MCSRIVRLNYYFRCLCVGRRRWDLHHKSSGGPQNLEQNSIPETPCQCFELQPAGRLMGEQD